MGCCHAGGVFDGAPLTPPGGVVKSTSGNHQFFSEHDPGWMYIDHSRVRKGEAWLIKQMLNELISDIDLSSP